MSTCEGPWPVQEFGRWGYVDASGVMVIRPHYDAARPFSEGVAAVCATTYGYVDATGSVVIDPAFQLAEDFVGGHAVCHFGSASEEIRAGVIDRAGAWIIAPRWERIDRRGTLWEVADAGERTGWLGATGDEWVAPCFEQAWSSDTGIVSATADGRPCTIDLATARVCELHDVDELGWPGDDSIAARRGEKWGWIGPEGAWILPPAWRGVESFSSDHAAVTGDDGRHGLVDRSGKVAIPVVHEVLRKAASGLWWCGDGGALWLVDCDGGRRGGPWLEFSYAAPEGLIFVRGAQGWGAISRDGAIVMPPRWEELADGGDGLVKARVGDRWGVLDPRSEPEARWILAPEHEFLATFHGGALMLDDGKALVDRRGCVLWRRPPPRAPIIAAATHRAPDWARVVEALPRLRAHTSKSIFGARGTLGEHQFAIGPALREDDISALEARHGVRLPSELRSFLAIVGNGPGVPPPLDGNSFETRGGAGPGYGMYDIRKALAASPRASSPLVPIRERAQVEAAVDTEDDYAPAGLVILGTYGCSSDYAMAVTGSWAGTMWTYVDPGWIPRTPALHEILTAHHEDYAAGVDWLRAHLEEVPIDTFADFYLAWLDEALSVRK